MGYGQLQMSLFKRLKQDFDNFLKADSNRLKKANYLHNRVEMMEQILKAAEHNNEQIVGAENLEKDLKVEDLEAVYEQILDLYSRYKIAVLDALDKLEPERPQRGKCEVTPSPVSSDQRPSEFRLPKINIPVFSGSYETWRSFHDLFVSLIDDNKSLSEVQKLHYPKSSVSGEAERLIQHLTIDNHNYRNAWGILNERYDHKRVLVNTQLKLLFSQPSSSEESASAIKKILDTSQEIVYSLNNLEIPVDHWDAILVFVVVQKLSTKTQQLWEEKLGTTKELPKLKEFFDFLECRFRALEAVGHQSGNGEKPKHSKLEAKVFHIKDSKPKYTACLICKKGQHALRECKAFLSMDVAQRLQAVQRTKVCENCLAYSHFWRNCPSGKSCCYCQQRHNTLLHRNGTPQFQPRTQPISTPRTATQPNISRPGSCPQYNTTRTHLAAVDPYAPEFHPMTNVQPEANVNTFHVYADRQVLLATALVSVRTSAGGSLTLRALVDPGSEASFITESALQRLNIKARRALVEINGLGRVSSGTAHRIADLEVNSLNSAFKGRMKALVLKSLTGLLPAQQIKVNHWQQIAQLQLADPTFHLPAKVDLLLGSEVYSEILLEGVIRCTDVCGPTAQKTQLGWILFGKVPESAERPESVRSFVSYINLDATLRRFWEVEEEPYEKVVPEEDRICEQHFRQNTVRLPDGRFSVRLPFQGGRYPRMAPTQQGAIKRFWQLEKRLQASPHQRDEYIKCLSEYIELGHMSPVEWSDATLQSPYHFFIPHHAVVKESSTTTRLRVVFDATFKSFGSSLNDMLMAGPKTQTDVFDIILRWRKYKYTFTGDIEKMYRQIQVEVPDSNYQLIVWRDNPNKELQVFRLNTVTFGTACAPFLAIRVLLHLAEEESKNFPLAQSIIREETYVDDVISGGDSIDEARQKLKAVRSMLATAGFQLRKHVSNTSEVLEGVPLEHREGDFTLPGSERSETKTLGLKWRPVSDTFAFQGEVDKDKGVSKRSILSAIARLYDPMGWLAPCVIKAKIIMQRLWAGGLEWDKPVPEKILVEWTDFREDLPAFQRVQIPRWIGTDQHNDLELHGFCDASERAYAAAVYARVRDNSGYANMRLLCAKSKVAPLKAVTLPRLELCGAVLLATLLEHTTRTLNREKVKVWAWTDSMITLGWIKAIPSRWKTFVGNRVAQIQRLTDNTLWRHITSGLNPADLASRGVMPSAIVDNVLWWSGPEFLRQEWNASVPEQPSYWATEEEVRPIKAHFVSAEDYPGDVIKDLLARCSTLNRATRVVAWCLRVRRSATTTRPIYLTADELQTALLKLVWGAQREMFHGGDKRHHPHKGYAALNPFTDENGILRVGGRLANSALSYEKKHPILLQPKHRLTELIVSDAHTTTLHGNAQKMIEYLRQRFWIMRIKDTVRQHVHNCNICYRFRAQPLVQLMGNLPAVRTTVSRPFTFTGVDYAGPIEIKTWKGRNAKTLKGYFAIFVCMAVKAVHIELVTDLTTQAFIAAFRRFVARRGLCRELFSDCGTNFKGSDTELRKQFAEAKVSWAHIAEVLENDGTKWNFIPPASPHFGGLWEAGVKSIKFHLKRVAGNQRLTFEELTTLLTQIEACLNSRPLCAQSDDITSYQSLTPGHFLIGEPLLAPPQPECQLEKISHLDRWRRVQALMQSFWKEWSNEYLSRLQQRPKWVRQNKQQPAVGDLVLLKEERLPPLKWNLGRVTQVHPGQDNLIRVVTVKTATTELKRPITKICLLPNNTPDPEVQAQPLDTKKGVGYHAKQEHTLPNETTTRSTQSQHP